MKAAVQLGAEGYADALSMTPGQVLFRLKLGSEREQRNLRNTAVAGRLAQADQKSWKAAMAEK